MLEIYKTPSGLKYVAVKCSEMPLPKALSEGRKKLKTVKDNIAYRQGTLDLSDDTIYFGEDQKVHSGVKMWAMYKKDQSVDIYGEW